MITDIYPAVEDGVLTKNLSMNDKCIPIRFNESQHLPWENPHDVVSQRVEAKAGQVRDLALAFLFLIGGPANVINMAVFYKQGLRDRVNLCLFVLAASDEVYLASGLLLHAENIYLHLSGQPIVTPVSRLITNNNLVFLLGSGFMSYFLSTVIACERCYLVLRPLKYQTLMKTRTVAVIVLVVYVVVLSLFFVSSYRYYISCVPDPVTGHTMMMMTGGTFYLKHRLLIEVMDGIIFGIGFPNLFVIIVITATILTTWKLRQIVTWRSEASSSVSAREVALTKMLVGTSVFFIICISPICVFSFVRLVLPELTAGGRYHNFALTTLWIQQMSTFFNSSLNFFIYYSMGSRYREVFWTMFGRKTAP